MKIIKLNYYTLNLSYNLKERKVKIKIKIKITESCNPRDNL